MKRAICLVLVLMVCITPCVLAEEITFRGIPWGSSMAEVEKALDLEYFYSYDDASMLKWRSVCEYDYSYAYDHPAGWSASSYGSDALTVAGYKACPTIYCAYGLSDDGKVLRGRAESIFYLGGYEFDVVDCDAAYRDIKEKLTGLYGEGVEEVTVEEGFYYTDSGNGSFDYEVRKTTWANSNGTGIKLHAVVSELNDPAIYTNSLSLWYGKTDMDDYLDELQAAIHREMVEAENASRSASVDGL